MKIKNKPLALDDYTTRQGKINRLNKPESLYSGMVISYIAVFLFMAIDFVCLESSWRTVSNDNQYLVMLISLGSAVALDCPMAVGAIVAKETVQGLRKKREGIAVVCLCIVCFLAVFALYICFRMCTRENTFSSNAATIQNSLSSAVVETNDADDGKVFYAGLFSAVLPFCTSVASFVISYFGCDPLGMKIRRLDKVIIQSDSNIIELKQALQETGNLREHAAFLAMGETDSYAGFVAEVSAESLLRKQTVRTTIMKLLQTPAEVAAIQQSGEELNQNTPVEKLPDSTEKYYLSII